MCVICYFFVFLQLVEERPRCTSVMHYWWILFKDSSLKKKKKKVVSCTTTWIKADGFYFHSFVSLNVDIGAKSTDEP